MNVKIGVRALGGGVGEGPLYYVNPVIQSIQKLDNKRVVYWTFVGFLS